MIDLHLHLDGSLTPEDILALAEVGSVPLPCRDAETLRPMLQAEADCGSLAEYLEKFDLPLQVLQMEQTITLAVYRLVKRLAKDGLAYAEIRFAPQLHLQQGLNQRQVVAAAVKGLESAIAEYKMPAQLILCCMRFADNQEANRETVRIAKEFLGKGVCLVDLAGPEAAFPTENFRDIFGLAKELEVPFIIHAGEAAGAESVWQALELGARRIGHGVRSTEDAALVATLAERKIPLEMCFTSNLQTKAVAKAENYPLCSFLEQGIVVTVNTDNMTVSGTDLRQEYRALQKAFGLSENLLIQLACNAAEAAYLPKEQKSALKNQIFEKFHNWYAGGQ